MTDWQLPLPNLMPAASISALSPITLGTVQLGLPYGLGAAQAGIDAASAAVLGLAVGARRIDAANAAGPGRVEDLRSLGAALAAFRQPPDDDMVKAALAIGRHFPAEIADPRRWKR